MNSNFCLSRIAQIIAQEVPHADHGHAMAAVGKGVGLMLTKTMGLLLVMLIGIPTVVLTLVLVVRHRRLYDYQLTVLLTGATAFLATEYGFDFVANPQRRVMDPGTTSTLYLISILLFSVAPGLAYILLVRRRKKESAI